MTVKDLLDILRFYPNNAEIFFENMGEKEIQEFVGISENVCENNKTRLVITTKEKTRLLRKLV